MKLSISDHILKVEVDLSRRLGPSRSGNSAIVAKTNGTIILPDSDGIKMSATVYRHSNSDPLESRPHTLYHSPGGNIKFTVSEGRKLTISINLDVELGLTQSRKFITIATTGPRSIEVSEPPSSIKMILDVYKPIENRPAEEQLSLVLNSVSRHSDSSHMF